jgi:hypothetical protein
VPRLPPHLPPWATDSLILHWPATPDTENLSLPRLHRRRRGLPASQPAQPARSQSLLQLYVWGGKNEQDDGQQVMHHLPAAEPHQLAGVPELADFYCINSIKQHAWSRANHTVAPVTMPCTCCSAGLAHRLEASTGLACPYALALAVTATALLTCLLTLLCVWLLAMHTGLPALLARLPAPRPAKQLVELPAGEVQHTLASLACKSETPPPPAEALAPASDEV